MIRSSKKETKKKEKKPVAYDLGLLFPVLLLVGMGIVMVYSASSALALKKFGSDYYFLEKQAFFSLIGIVVLVAFRYIPFGLYRSLVYPVMITALAMLALVAFTNLGASAGGASRWLKIGPIRFQPSELARLALVIYLAYSMSKKDEQVRDFLCGIPAPFSGAGSFCLSLDGPARFRIRRHLFRLDLDHAFRWWLPHLSPSWCLRRTHAICLFGHVPGPSTV